MHELVDLVIASACLLVAIGLVVLLVAPKGHFNVRDFTSLPGRQLQFLNTLDLCLTVASLITAGFAVTGHLGAYPAELIIAILCAAVFALDISSIVPRLRVPLPIRVFVVEVVGLGLSAALIIIAIWGMFR